MSRNPRQIAARRPGFTLIEIGVVLLLVAVIAGMAVPAISSVTGAETRGAISRLAANIRASRGQAAISGRTCRVVFDLGDKKDDGGGQTYSIECAKGHVTARAEKERNDARVEDGQEPTPEELERMSDRERARYEISRKAAFSKDPVLPPQRLPGTLEFFSVWTAHQEDPYKKGKAYLYFYPTGTAERANIQLRDGDDYWSVHVSSLAGRVRILPGREELKNEAED